MMNYSNYYCLVLLLIYVIKACSSEGFIIDDLELESSSIEDSGSNDNGSESGLQLYQDVCDLPIDAGDCKTKSRATHENDFSGIADEELEAINEVYHIKDLYEVNEQFGLKKRNELKDPFKRRTRFFGYNRNMGRCEEFIYEGCGGNDNRFDSLKKCRKTCYTSLKYFLSEVTDLLLFKIANSPEEFTT